MKTLITFLILASTSFAYAQECHRFPQWAGYDPSVEDPILCPSNLLCSPRRGQAASTANVGAAQVKTCRNADGSIAWTIQTGFVWGMRYRLINATVPGSEIEAFCLEGGYISHRINNDCVCLTDAVEFCEPDCVEMPAPLCR